MLRVSATDGVLQAHAIGDRLARMYPGKLRFEYVDMLDPRLDRFPEVLEKVSAEGLQLPLVYVGDELFSAGGKINGPGLRHRIEQILALEEL